MLKEGKLRLEKIHTNLNLADAFTKVVSNEKLEFGRASLGLISF
jgi:hypothetical protein